MLLPDRLNAMLAINPDIIKGVEGFDHSILGFCPASNRYIYSIKEIMVFLNQTLDESDAMDYFDKQFAGREDIILCFDY